MVTPSWSIASTMAFVRTSTPISTRSRRARSEISSENVESTRGPASTRTMWDFAGSMRRKSPRIAVRLMSAIAPASSTPVGPPPTTTKVRYARCLSGSFSFSAQLECDQHAPADLGRLLECLEAGRELLPLRMAEITVAGAARENQVVERNLAIVTEHRPALEIHPADMAEVNLDVWRSPELHANRNRDVGGIQARGRHLIQQRLEQVMIPMVDENDRQIVVVRERLRRVQSGEPCSHDDGGFHETRSILTVFITTGFTGRLFAFMVATLPIAVRTSMPSTSFSEHAVPVVEMRRRRRA